ncbi:hypothetical protein fugu_000389 [Takifugu bimaculatus]|uniref:Protein kinase domain-containing protein n=1 Tax=Takifugu bimaculatus TaxID=433685 RepID=A0A4Z2CGV5_9TELE|nr:hypothetical protein fugu_000389 [Takifugu bimaculatus]
MQHGTAKHVVREGDEDRNCLSIVAQAEREDFQEFSPSNTQCPYSRSQLLRKYRFLNRESAFRSDSEDEDEARCRLQRKQRRKWGRGSPGGGEERPVIQGLWVHEVDWLKSGESSSDVIPPPPQFTDPQPCGPADEDAGCSCTDVCECATGQSGDTDCDLDQDSESNSSGGGEDDAPVTADLTFDLMQVSSASDVRRSDSAGSLHSLLGDSHSAPSGVNKSQCAFGSDEPNRPDAFAEVLRGRVTQMTKASTSPLFRSLIKGTLREWRGSERLHEGLIFHHQLRPSRCQYREGEEYRVLHHIQNGSYGDVFCVRDAATGFTCAAKRVPLGRFSPEEVSTWSVLSSPRVVELFGAVREGPNVVLFMDLKPACLAQLLRETSSLPEDLALHYLLQTLGALEHLHHRKVLHLDVKVENVLLSADCRDTFLCDFGLSETVDDNGWSNQAFRGGVFPGTETHMAPEVARGDPLSAKADVWSSCCMLLHMLNGCRPWTRYYSHPLCLQIVNEPPPMWEVPSNCNHFTAKVFRAGLRKDPERRASATVLRRKTTKALRAVGGLSLRSVRTACEKLYRGKTEDSSSCSSSPETTSEPSAAVSAPAVFWVSPWRTTAVDEDSSDGNVSEAESGGSEPRSLQAEEDWDCWTDSEVDLYTGEDEYAPEKSLRADRDYEGDWEEEGDDGDEEEWSSPEYLQVLTDLFPLLQKGQPTVSCGSEKELEYLRDGESRKSSWRIWFRGKL